LALISSGDAVLLPNTKDGNQPNSKFIFIKLGEYMGIVLFMCLFFFCIFGI